jgi:hypothetical protein
MPEKVTLKVVAGPMKGRTYSFSAHDTFVFGRSSDCTPQLPDDKYVSRHHFILEVNPPQANIRDLGSRNGTHLNLAKIGAREPHETPEEGAKRTYPEVSLQHDDVIQVGDTQIRVLLLTPPLCCECGVDIADELKPACQWMNGALICPDCRARLEQGGAPPPPIDAVRCRDCGQDVGREVSPSLSRADYVCRECRQRAEIDPLPLIRRMSLPLGSPGIAPYVEHLDRYEVVRQLGRGGMGAVYLARRKDDGQEVAIKVMLSRIAVREHQRRLFLREIEVARSLNHPNVVELLEFGPAGGGFYFVMALCAGGSLAAMQAARGGRIPLAEAMPIILQALDGLAYAHACGIVHRDLKPANILLSGPEGGMARIADFGLAKSFVMAGFSGMTVSSGAAGTPEFMPREQVTRFRHLKPVSDVWSMGATLYYAITGAAPRRFPAGVDPMRAVLEEPIVPIRERDPSIPFEVAAVIERALDDDVSRRYQTAVAFSVALKGAMEGGASS